MLLSDLEINYSYDTGEDDLLLDFYVPALKHTVRYDRIAGYFSSSSLAVAAKGIAGLIANNGKMRLIASPNLSENDAKIINSSQDELTKIIDDYFIDDIEDMTDMLQKKHVQALGWMLKRGFLEIKLVCVKDKYGNRKSAIFHQKIGVMKDIRGDRVTFSGSINETASGWLHNVEEFKVFKSWVEIEKKYLLKDEKKFEDIWNGNRLDLEVMEISKAVEKCLIKVGEDFDKEDFIAQDYIKYSKKQEINEKLNLFWYQKDGIKKWMKNEKKLLFEMATGTGKTRVGIGALFELLEDGKEIVAIVSCPQNSLSLQWKNEIENIGLSFDESLIIDGTNRNWKADLESCLRKIKVGFYSTAIIYTTHKTCSNLNFIETIKKYKLTYCFVGDEAHGLGAKKTRNGLLDLYEYRIGLSATPNRWFDEIGSELIINYFGDNSYIFSIQDALTNINPLTRKSFLVNYYYYPIFVSLNDEEIEEYKKLTKKIQKLACLNKADDDYKNSYESLLFSRANIIKNAKQKYEQFNLLLDEKKIIDKMLIFTTDVQLPVVMKSLVKEGVIAHRFAQQEGCKSNKRFNNLSERQYIIEKFKEGVYQALVAIKCLDEGIDIPEADTAILMGNSGNPREYIQRIGRVIRQGKNKKRAAIYDFIVEPSVDRLGDVNLIEFEQKVFEKELERVKDMSKNAINNSQVFSVINEKMRGVKYGTK